MDSASGGLDFQFRQAPGGEADHIAEQVGVQALLQQCAKMVTSFVIVVLSLGFLLFDINPS